MGIAAELPKREGDCCCALAADHRYLAGFGLMRFSAGRTAPQMFACTVLLVFCLWTEEALVCER